MFKNFKNSHALGACALLGSIGIGVYVYIKRKNYVKESYIKAANQEIYAEEDSDLTSFEALEREISDLIQNTRADELNSFCPDNSNTFLKTSNQELYNIYNPIDNKDEEIEKISCKGSSLNTYPKRQLNRHLSHFSDHNINNSTIDIKVLSEKNYPPISRQLFLESSPKFIKSLDIKQADNYAKTLEAALNDAFLNGGLGSTLNKTDTNYLLNDINSSLNDSSNITNDSEIESLKVNFKNYQNVIEPRFELLIKTLNTISNLSAFSENQILFREVGCLNHLMRILATSLDCRILTSCAQCIANLSLNQENQNILKECVPFMLKLLLTDYLCNHQTTKLYSPNFNSTSTPNHNYKEESKKRNLINLNSRFAVVALNALVNLTVLEPCTEAFCGTFLDLNYHKDFKNDVLSKILTKFISDQKNYEIKLSALKLVVNLSCYSQNLPYLSQAKVDKNILFLFGSTIDSQILLRAITLLEHIIKFMIDINRSSTDSPFSEETFQSTRHYTEQFTFDLDSLAAIILSNSNFLKGKMSQLKCHRNSEIRDIASKIYGYLNTSSL